MELKRRIALNDAQLDEVDGSIIIESITENAPQYSVNSLDFGNGIGQAVLNRKRQYLDVKVDFVICEKAADTEAMRTRADILKAVTLWAMSAEEGAWLTVSYRPEQRLRVHLTAIPAASDICDWNEPITMTFRAFAPFWQGSGRISATYEKVSEQEITLAPECSLRCPVGFTLKNTGSGTLNTASVTLGAQSMTFTGLALAANQTLSVTYADDLTQKMQILDEEGNFLKSAQPMRDINSADDIWLTPGASNSVSVASNITGDWSLFYIERWA